MEEKVKFDSERYMKESQDRDFLMGKKAADEERFDDVRLLFSKAYGNGNVLAGVHIGEIYSSGKGVIVIMIRPFHYLSTGCIETVC